MERASRNDWFILVRGVVKTLMVLAGEVPLHATVSMGGGGGLLLRTGASAATTSQYVALISVSGGLLLSVNCLIFVIFVIAREGFYLGIPAETRSKSVSTHGDNGNQHITTIDVRYFQTLHTGQSVVRSRRN